MSTDGPGPNPNRILLVVGGERGVPGWTPPTSVAADLVVAADSGLDAALAAGIHVHHAVGDFDSVAPGSLVLAERAGTHLHRHAADKDATDIELALDLVLELFGPDLDPARRPSLVVTGPGGGRLDHLLADLLLASSPRFAALEVTARFGETTATVVSAGRSRLITGRARDQVSLLPVHGTARGVTTVGLRWALLGAELAPGTTRGISNELEGPSATVEVAEGTVLVLQPGTVAAAIAPRATAYDPTPLGPASVGARDATIFENHASHPSRDEPRRNRP